MPESSSRKNKVNKPKVAKPVQARSQDEPNPAWFAPVMFGFMLLGLAWIITFYVSGAMYPLGAGVPALNLGNWNILIGFGIAMVGGVMITRWK
jgi:hypothetical protein